MAKAVINPFEVVDVDQNQCPMAFALQKLAQKRPAVEQAGKRVGVGHGLGNRLGTFCAIAGLREQPNASANRERIDQRFECECDEGAVFDQHMIRQNADAVQYPGNDCEQRNRPGDEKISEERILLLPRGMDVAGHE